MKHHYPVPIAELPEDLSGEAAALIVETLHEFARVIENHYAKKIRRHYQQPDERQCRLWDETDPPF